MVPYRSIGRYTIRLRENISSYSPANLQVLYIRTVNISDLLEISQENKNLMPSHYVAPHNLPKIKFNGILIHTIHSLKILCTALIISKNYLLQKRTKHYTASILTFRAAFGSWKGSHLTIHQMFPILSPRHNFIAKCTQLSLISLFI